jgi:hypothetical protein
MIDPHKCRVDIPVCSQAKRAMAAMLEKKLDIAELKRAALGK